MKNLVGVCYKLSNLQYLHESIQFPLPISDRGKYTLGGLFYETLQKSKEVNSPIQDTEGSRPLFTLKVYDWDIPPESIFFRKDGCNKLRSLHQLYLEAEDPSEYDFAVSTLGNYEHWKALIALDFFQPFLKEMRDTLGIKLDAKTVRAAKLCMSEGTGPVALQAAKWLNARVVKTGKTRGRPSNDEIEGELKRKAEERAEIEQDLRRLG